MFIDFFYLLRKRKVPVSMLEWMTLMEALAKGYAFSNLTSFYYLARAILVKSETHYDQYDVAFREYFQGIETPAEIADQVLEWLNDPVAALDLSPDELAELEAMNFEDLLRTFEDRLREQKEKHDGGQRWIGTGGTSPFGHSGRNPAGVRLGGESRGHSAVQVAVERHFQNYRSDVVLDTRQIQAALKQLRQLGKVGPKDQLDLRSTIDATCRNAGELEFIWDAERRNNVKLLLLMDVGGSMDQYAHLCNLLFSATNGVTHFKDYKYYYFHNCVYGNLYTDIERREGINTDHILRTLDADYRVILVGDATMATTELDMVNGAIDYWEQNETPGIVWLKRIADHFTHCIWLNPQSERTWMHPTVTMVAHLFPMYELTLDGLDRGIKKLIVRS